MKQIKPKRVTAAQNGSYPYVVTRLKANTDRLVDLKLVYDTAYSIASSVNEFVPQPTGIYLFEDNAYIILQLTLPNDPEVVKQLQQIKGLQYPKEAGNYKATLQISPTAGFKVTGKATKKEISIKLYQTESN